RSVQGLRLGTRIAAAAVLATLAVLSAAAAAPRTALPRVTVIGDSVASALGGNPGAVTILGDGLNLDLELAPCRRVGQDSCPFGAVRPPTVIQYVESKGIALGQTVVVVVGYNDFEDAYATNIEDALAALQKAGVPHVLW